MDRLGYVDNMVKIDEGLGLMGSEIKVGAMAMGMISLGQLAERRVTCSKFIRVISDQECIFFNDT